MIGTKLQSIWSLLTSKIDQLHTNQVDYVLQRSSVFYHACANPLTSLMLNLELANQHAVTNTNLYLLQAKQSAQYMTELFRQLAPHQTTTQFHLASAINETIGLLRCRYDQSITITQHGHPPAQLWLSGRKLFFQELLLSICHNAIESYQAGARQLILLTHLDSAKSYQLAVTDGGRGISRWQRQLVFRDGLSLKKNHQGIGLPLAKRLMVNHFKGKISLQSQLQRGTTVVMEFPKSV